VVYTAETDPSHLLGRPGQYLSQAMFADSRIHPSSFDQPESVDRGGSVEVRVGKALTPAQAGEYQMALEGIG
jgi:hypothetical protein